MLIASADVKVGELVRVDDQFGQRTEWSGSQCCVVRGRDMLDSCGAAVRWRGRVR